MAATDLNTLDLTNPLVFELRHALAARRKLADQEDELKEQKKYYCTLIEEQMTELGLGSVKDPGIGTAAIVTQERSSIKKDRLQDALLQRGMDVPAINSLLLEVTDKSVSMGLRFTPDKPRKRASKG